MVWGKMEAKSAKRAAYISGQNNDKKQTLI